MFWGEMGGFGALSGCIGVRMFLVMRVSGFVSFSIIRVLLVFFIVCVVLVGPFKGYVTVWLRVCQGVSTIGTVL